MPRAPFGSSESPASGPSTLPASQINGKSQPPGQGGESLGAGIGPSESRSAARTGQVVYREGSGQLGAAEQDPTYGAGKPPAGG